ncbi:rhomboid family intramembrane serine protease [Compostibacter hankyongensis]|uniref:Peptidase S54 rhomboid domain-containing protein n=1 Tax=Compostibacter hankyongensis TaxID=1007089 RepID=A0ABP8FK60_9BACT
MMMDNMDRKYIRQERVFSFTPQLKTDINILVFAHILLFAVYQILHWSNIGAQADIVTRHSLALSAHPEDRLSHLWSIFTYPFVHFNVWEVLLSSSMLWLFGNILSLRLGAKKVLGLYLVCCLAAAGVFLLAYVIFPIYSGEQGMLEGTFCGVLGVMTAAVVMFSHHEFRVTKRFSVSLLQVYVISLTAALFLIIKHDLASITAHLISMYFGYQYAVYLLKSQPSPAA